MKTRLENQIAIVTGSSSGNGRAIALALSSAGATVVCADLNKNARKEGYEEDIEIDTDDVIRRAVIISFVTGQLIRGLLIFLVDLVLRDWIGYLTLLSC
jgi:NAD(P)-dependent dehydrogenase (short-subunit alcohol dehydrogenase family)